MRCHVVATSRIHKPRGRRHIRWNWEGKGIRCITNHTNGISDDVLKVNCGNGDSGSRRLGVSLDTAFHPSAFCVFFFFFLTRFGKTWLLFMYCSMNSNRKCWLFCRKQCIVYCSWTHKFHFLATFSLKMDPTILFTHLKIILLQWFQQ